MQLSQKLIISALLGTLSVEEVQSIQLRGIQKPVEHPQAKAQPPVAHPQKTRANGFDVVAGALGSVYKPHESKLLKIDTHKSKQVIDVEKMIAEKQEKREEMAAKTAAESKKEKKEKKEQKPAEIKKPE